MAREFIDGFTQWQSDPRAVCVNREPSRALFYRYSSMERACAGEPFADDTAVLLNGKWRFRLYPDFTKRPDDFAQPDFQARGWDTVTVPHVFAAPECANALHDVPTPYAPAEQNPVGCYVRRFMLPARWSGRRVVIRFCGVSSAFFLYVNGERAGYSEGGYAAEFDITQLLHPGANTIGVEVYALCTGSRLAGGGAAFGGLYRDVWVYSTDMCYLSDLQVTAQPGPEMRDGILEVRVSVAHPVAGLRAELTVFSDDSRAEAFDAVDVSPAGEAALHTTIAAARLWSGETPYLYTAVVTLRGDAGVLEYIPLRVGFRKVELRGGALYINAHRAALKGVVYKAALPNEGDEAHMRACLCALKQNNCNAVIVSQPAAPVFYDLCDALGLYVIDCAGLDTAYTATGRGGDFPPLPGELPDWAPAVLDRVKYLYENDKNRTCVIGRTLSLMDCGMGESLQKAGVYLNARDSGRFLMDVAHHGATPAQIGAVRCGLHAIPAEAAGHSGSLFCIAPAAGNTGGSLEQCAALLYANGALQGLFLEECPVLLDDGVVNPVIAALRTPFSPVGIRILDAERGRIAFDNHSDVFDLSDFDVYWEQRSGESALRGSDVYVCAKPGESAVVDLELNRICTVEWYLRVLVLQSESTPWINKGDTVAFASGVANRGRLHLPPDPDAPDPILPEPHCTVGYRSILATGMDFAVQISRQTGLVTGIKMHGMPVLAQGISLNFWRAPTLEDRAACRDLQSAFWRDAGSRVKGAVTRLVEAGGEIKIDSELTLPGGAQVQLFYTVTGAKLYVEYVFTGAAHLPPVPEVGVQFALCAPFHAVRYIGLGGAENYTDRTGGAEQGIYREELEHCSTNYAVPQENGMRCDVRMLELIGANATLRIDAPQGIGVNLCKWSPTELEAAGRPADLPQKAQHHIRLAAAQAGISPANGFLPADRTYKMQLIFSFGS